jgi:hypothetical protein
MSIVYLMISIAYLERPVDKRLNVQYTQVFLVGRDYGLSNALSNKDRWCAEIKYII